MVDKDSGRYVGGLVDIRRNKHTEDTRSPTLLNRPFLKRPLLNQFNNPPPLPLAAE